MTLSKEKIKLMQKRRQTRLDDRPLWPSKENLNYLRNFFIKEKRLLIFSLLALFAQGLLEVALILISHRYLKTSSALGAMTSQGGLLVLLLIFSLLYLLSAYRAIKGERTLIVRLINDLRERWFRLFVNKRPEEHNLEGKSMVLSKIAYHLPLLSTGLSASLAGLVRWLLLVAILLFLSFTFGYQLLLFTLGAVIVGILIAIGAGLVSYRYVSKETTFYSQILRFIDLNLSDWRFVKSFRRERPVVDEFRKLVDLDSFFRVRRDLWLRFSVSLVFILLIFISFGAGAMGTQLEYYFGTASNDARFIFIIALVYFSRLLYESLRIGLYSVPFALGLKLSVPEFIARRLGRRQLFKADKLIFSSSKSKLFKQAKSYRAFRFEFDKGGRYLCSGVVRSGRSLLAKLLCGEGVYGRRAWLLKAGDKKYFYNEFFEKYAGFYYLDPNFTSSRSLLETVVGKEKTAINELEFARASGLINEHKLLRDIFSVKEDWRLRADKFLVNSKNILLIQIVYCLLNKPYLIALDNAWTDRRDKEVEDLLLLLEKLLPDTIIVVMADRENKLFNYREHYEI
ncbi:MAG: ABC transporter transmembrane domain-containing protein [Patescibacteria group bacterium]|nr:ABC transporter transmembrane domain-containing protein [Patescibacteria group bacterium]